MIKALIWFSCVRSPSCRSEALSLLHNRDTAEIKSDRDAADTARQVAGAVAADLDCPPCFRGVGRSPLHPEIVIGGAPFDNFGSTQATADSAWRCRRRRRLRRRRRHSDNPQHTHSEGYYSRQSLALPCLCLLPSATWRRAGGKSASCSEHRVMTVASPLICSARTLTTACHPRSMLIGGACT